MALLKSVDEFQDTQGRGFYAKNELLVWSSFPNMLTEISQLMVFDTQVTVKA